MDSCSGRSAWISGRYLRHPGRSADSATRPARARPSDSRHSCVRRLGRAPVLDSAARRRIFGLIGGYLTDRIGRKRILVWTILIYIVSATAAGFSTSLGWLLVWRTLSFIDACVEFCRVSRVAGRSIHRAESPRARARVDPGVLLAWRRRGVAGQLPGESFQRVVSLHLQRPRGVAIHADVGGDPSHSARPSSGRFFPNRPSGNRSAKPARSSVRIFPSCSSPPIAAPPSSHLCSSPAPTERRSVPSSRLRRSHPDCTKWRNSSPRCAAKPSRRFNRSRNSADWPDESCWRCSRSPSPAAEHSARVPPAGIVHRPLRVFLSRHA